MTATDAPRGDISEVTQEYTSGCKCLKTLNAKLAPHNGTVLVTLFGGLPIIATQKVDDKKRTPKMPLVIASFCPFCGAEFKKKGAVPDATS